MIRNFVIAFFVLLIIEGALRKWLFPEASAEIFAVKDVVLLLGLVVFLATDYKSSLSYFQRSELVIWGLWVVFVLGYFLLRSPTIAGLIGLRYYLAPLPLLLLMPYAIGGTQSLRRFAIAALAVTIPLCLLGIVQYLSPIDAPINRYAWFTGDDDIAGFGVSGDDFQLGLALDRPRITSTFSYIATYAAYLMFAVLAGWAVLAGSVRPKAIFLASAVLLLIFANLAMTGSRGPFAIAVVLSLPFAYILARRIWRSNSPATVLTALFVPLLGIVMIFAVDAFESLAARTQQADDNEERIVEQAITPIIVLSHLDFLGKGIGSTFAGMGELGGSDVAEVADRQEVADRTGVELGYLGYLFMLLLKFTFLVKSWSLFRKTARAPDLQVWALTALAVQISSTWSIPFHNAIASSFYFVGLAIFLCTRKEFRMRIARAAANHRPHARQFSGTGSAIRAVR